MEQNTKNWVKFDDCAPVTDIKLTPGSATLVLTPEVVRQSGHDTKISTKNNSSKSCSSFPVHASNNYSRYSVFEQLRVELGKSSDMGWSTHLLGKQQGKEEPMNWKKRG